MNNTFNLTRTGWLLKKTILERPAQLLGLTLLSFLLSFVIYFLVKLMAGFEAAQQSSFITGMIGGGCFLASFINGHFSSNASGSSFLTLPASQFEKWLCGVIITGIAYIFLFLLFFRLIDTAFVSVYHNSLDPHNVFYKQAYEAVNIFPFDEFIAKKVYEMYFNFAGIMLLGSLYFNKAAFIKVALITCVACVGLFLLNILIAQLLMGNVQTAFPYFMVWLFVGKDRARLDLPGDTLRVINFLFSFVIPAFLWGLSLLRLREKEF
jgi:hypothetical protein